MDRWFKAWKPILCNITWNDVSGGSSEKTRERGAICLDIFLFWLFPVFSYAYAYNTVGGSLYYIHVTLNNIRFSHFLYDLSIIISGIHCEKMAQHFIAFPPPIKCVVLFHSIASNYESWIMNNFTWPYLTLEATMYV